MRSKISSFFLHMTPIPTWAGALAVAAFIVNQTTYGGLVAGFLMSVAGCVFLAFFGVHLGRVAERRRMYVLQLRHGAQFMEAVLTHAPEDMPDIVKRGMQQQFHEIQAELREMDE